MPTTPGCARASGSTADAITVRDRGLATEPWDACRSPSSRSSSTSGTSPTAGQARLLDAVLVSLAEHGLTPTSRRAAHLHGRAGVAPGRGRRGPARRGQRVPRRRRGHGALPRGRRRRHRRLRRRARAGGARGGRARVGAGERVPDSGIRSTRPRTRARRGSTRSRRSGPARRQPAAAAARRAPSARGDRPRAADQRRRRRRRGAGGPRVPARDRARLRPDRAHSGARRPPGRGAAAASGHAAVPRGRRRAGGH